jgi:hypothetical protein
MGSSKSPEAIAILGRELRIDFERECEFEVDQGSEGEEEEVN